LIEGPSDATDILKSISGKNVVPPIAILAYSKDLPVETVMYPMAEYSPEYQAILWAAKKAEARFIDLPSGVLLSMNKWRQEEFVETEDEELKEYYQSSHKLYDEIAGLDMAVNYDDYFEKNFEHNLSDGSYNAVIKLESSETRHILEPMEFSAQPAAGARNLVREAYMAMQIEAAVNEGFKPEEIVVVTGAYHADRLLESAPMTEEELKTLPARESMLTLMPYSFYRLSARSGYGAGNNAPAYYQLMWECMKEGRLESLPEEYGSRLGKHIRESGGYCSTAHVIETARLAKGLAYLKDRNMPTLADLHDAAISCIGQGEVSELAPAFAMLDVGTRFGQLPEGVSQTPVQDDFNRELKRLKLDKYKTTVAEELELDLRENIRVTSKEAAFIDLDRSTFFHRLAFLDINFAKKSQTNQDGATWREKWILQWTPEVEIQIVETVLKGETIELAAAFSLKEKLEECKDTAEAADLITAACVAKLTDGIEPALKTLQRLTADSLDFVKTADAAHALSTLIQYGDLRKFDTDPLLPILKQLFLKASLLLVDYAGISDEASGNAVSAMNAMHIVSQENYGEIDDETWVKELTALAARDDKNPKLSGLAFSILLERGFIDEDFCAREVSRRLSPGIPADIGAGWFEGMSMRNRYVLLSRTNLWKELDSYLGNLDDDEFKRSVVFLRRAFSNFEPKEKNSIAELLGEIWSIDSSDASILLQAPLDEAEAEALAGLEKFDFDI
jgi:hypothetical protein